MTYTTDEWTGCYDLGWKGIITDAAFAHPAKFSRGFIKRIYEHALEEGWVQPGSIVIDPFGGVALGAWVAMQSGLAWVGNELEPKFVELGQGSDCTGISRADWVRFYGRWVKGSDREGRHYCPDCLADAGQIAGGTEDKPKSQAQAIRRKRIAALAKKKNRPHRLYPALPLPGTQVTITSLSFMVQSHADGATYRRNSYIIPHTAAHRYKGNIERWREKYPDWPGSAVLLQGDSRRLADVVREAGLVVGSPPYATDVVHGDKSAEARLNRKNAPANKWGLMASGELTQGDYGTTPGQLAALPPGSPPTLISSPPFAGNSGGRGEASRNGIDPALFDRHSGGMIGGMGEEQGNLGNLPMGEAPDVAQARPPVVVVGSPPYATGDTASAQSITQRTDKSAEWIKQNCGSAANQGYGTTPGQLAALPPGSPPIVMSSPPYAVGEKGHPSLGSVNKDDWGNDGRDIAGRRGLDADYGQTPGQLAALPAGSPPVVVMSSPPYAESLNSEKNGIDWSKVKKDYPGREMHEARVEMAERHHNERRYGSADGQLGAMPPGSPPSVHPPSSILVSSPPFAGSVGSDDPAKRGGLLVTDPRRAGDVNLTGSYGDSEGQLGRMVVGSPPYEGCDIGAKEKRDGENRLAALRVAQASGKVLGRESLRVLEKGLNQNTNLNAVPGGYGSTDGQLGQDSGDTFWSAARLIVEQCALLLPPGAFAIWVVKAYVKNGQIVDFPGQWQALCEACGFETVCVHHALLVKKNGAQAGLDGEMVNKDVARKSFFRRLAERKGSPAIDYETVLCTRRKAE